MRSAGLAFGWRCMIWKVYMLPVGDGALHAPPFAAAGPTRPTTDRVTMSSAHGARSATFSQFVSTRSARPSEGNLMGDCRLREQRNVPAALRSRPIGPVGLSQLRKCVYTTQYSPITTGLLAATWFDFDRGWLFLRRLAETKRQLSTSALPMQLCSFGRIL